MSGETLQVAAHIASAKFEQLPEAAIHAAERSLLDAVGVMLGATTLGEDCAAFADLASAALGRCTVLGRSYKFQPLNAALANGALAHALDYEDALDGAPVHPNAAVVPVVMALAEQLSDISGRDLLLAQAVGCDLVCRLGLALDRNPDEFGWYPPPILSTFGAAAAAASLLRLTTDQTAHALALALAQATFSSEFKTTPDSSLRAVRDGFAAHSGLLAALLAQKGVRGHMTALEGKAGFFALFARGAWTPQRLTENLGRDFLGANVSFKPWPSCRGTHAFIEAALQLRDQAPPGSIDSIESSGPPLLTMLVEPAPQKQAPATAIDAKFSLPYCIAAALIDGRITIPSFDAAARQRPDVLALARRVRFIADPGISMKDAASGTLTLHLNDGRKLSRHIAEAAGSPASPLSDAALTAKFRDCASYASPRLSPLATDQLIECLLSMRSRPRAADAFAPLHP